MSGSGRLLKNPVLFWATFGVLVVLAVGLAAGTYLTLRPDEPATPVDRRNAALAGSPSAAPTATPSPTPSPSPSARAARPGKPSPEKTSAAKKRASAPAMVPRGWQVAFEDPLTDEGAWQPEGDQEFGGRCFFDRGGLKVEQLKPNRIWACRSGLADSFEDFAFEVKATIVGSSGCAEVVFRSGSSEALYVYGVCADGNAYARVAFSPARPLVPLLDRKGVDAGQGNAVTLGIVADGSELTFYADGKRIGAATDNQSKAGRFFLRAGSTQNPVTVGFRDFRVWTP